MNEGEEAKPIGRSLSNELRQPLARITEARSGVLILIDRDSLGEYLVV